MNRTFPNINTLWAHVLVDEFARCGLRRVVHSPGSRSTPLVLACAAHPDITLHAVLDERCAAFFALGLAKSHGDTVAVLCTSGTAAANLFPAVCEADLAETPLLVLTADRPRHLHESGAPQTMDQTRLYGRHVRLFANVTEAEADEEKLRALRSLACRAMQCTRELPRGPVHLNIPFRKPLEANTAVKGPGAIPASFNASGSVALLGRLDGRPWIRHIATTESADQHTVDMLADLLRTHNRVLILAGPDADGAMYRRALSRFSTAAAIPVMAESASQQRFVTQRESLVLAASSLLARDPRYRECAMPDLVMRIGGVPTTTSMQTFVAEHGEVEHVFISPSPMPKDPEHMRALRVRCTVAPLFDALASRFEACPRANADAAWINMLADADSAAIRCLNTELPSLAEPFSGEAARRIGLLMPEDSALVVSSSMPLRDLETYAAVSRHTFSVFCNRGVNGIDGVTSTALGIARALRGRTVLLTGDVAFLHDSNAMLIARDEHVDLTVVLVNNNGGEIFNMLPIRDFDPPFTRHFVMPHGMDMRALLAAYGIAHELPRDWDHFTELLGSEAQGVRVIEVRTDMSRSRELRNLVHSSIMENVSPLLRNHEPSPQRKHKPLSTRLLSDGVGRDTAPALFLHGFTRSAVSWQQCVRELHYAGRLYAADLPGHGDSHRGADVNDYTMDAACGGLHSVLGHIGIERMHLVGYSMGGRIALLYALTYPSAVASLAVISASPGIADADERRARANADALLADSILTGGLEEFLDTWSAQPLLAPPAASTSNAHSSARCERNTSSSAALALSLRGMGQGTQQPLWARLTELHMPVMIVAGETDRKYTTIARSMHTLVPHASVNIIPGAGHDVPGDAPSALADALTAFWRGALS